MTTKPKENVWRRYDQRPATRIRPVGEPQPPPAPHVFDLDDVVMLLEGLHATGSRVHWGGRATTQLGYLKAGIAEAEAAGGLWRASLAWFEATHAIWRWARRRRGETPDSVEQSAALGQQKALEAQLDLDQRLALERWLEASWVSPRACLLCQGKDGQHETRGRRLP